MSSPSAGDYLTIGQVLKLEIIRTTVHSVRQVLFIHLLYLGVLQHGVTVGRAVAS